MLLLDGDPAVSVACLTWVLDCVCDVICGTTTCLGFVWWKVALGLKRKGFAVRH